MLTNDIVSFEQLGPDRQQNLGKKGINRTKFEILGVTIYEMYYVMEPQYNYLMPSA